MPTIKIGQKDSKNKETRFVTVGLVESEYGTTNESIDSCQITGDFSTDTISVVTKGKVEVEETATN